ncbi:MAG TPA: hypothetical protein DER64_16895 [Planctomycetaceae bacterium]|nr:hypothetical protein [Planctomycetaceae bacterium]
MAEDVLTVDVEYEDVHAFADETRVGHLYEVGINGVGYLLANNPAEQREYRRQTVPLDPERLATSDTPFSEAIERYSFAAADTWETGAGQKYLHRSQSTASAFRSSSGLDPFTEEGIIKLLPVTVEEEAETYANLRMVVVGRTLYYQSDDEELSSVATFGASPTTLATSSAGTAVLDLTSDGQYWYACNGADIFRGTTSGSTWSTQNAYEIQWAAGRICAAVASAGSTPNRFTTLTDAGAEEKASGHLTLPAGSTITLGGSAAGHFYFGGYQGGTGSVYAWPLGLNVEAEFHAPFEALEMPAGMIPAAVATGGGYVWVRAYRPEGASTGQALILQCVPGQDGSLVATTVAEIAPVGTSASHQIGGFAVHENVLLFGWKTMVGAVAGVGAVNLATGGYAKWFAADGDGDVPSIDVWQGQPVFAVRGQGIFRTHATNKITTGELQTSLFDGASGLFKVWDDVSLNMAPLGAGEAITLSTTTDGGASFAALTGGTVSEAMKSHTVPIGKQSKDLGLKLTFTGPASGGGGAPLSFLSTRYHPLGLADTLVRIPIDCGDFLTGINGAPLAENGEGAGVRRARALQNLVQTRVRYQDIDWHVTGATEVFEVEACDLTGVSLYDPSRSGASVRLIANLTLRKVGT